MVIKNYKLPPRIEVRTVRDGKRVSDDEFKSDPFFSTYPAKPEVDNFRKAVQKRTDLKDNTVYVVQVSEQGITLIEESA